MLGGLDVIILCYRMFHITVSLVDFSSVAKDETPCRILDNIS